MEIKEDLRSSHEEGGRGETEKTAELTKSTWTLTQIVATVSLSMLWVGTWSPPSGARTASSINV